jgi:SNF2 family DNA or RNA helicase
MKVFAELSPTQEHIDVHFKYDAQLVAMAKEVPGYKYVPPDKGGPLWRYPLTLTTGRRLRETYGAMLELGVGIKAWGKDERDKERNLGAIARADDWALADMQLPAVHPDLAAYLRPYQRADVAMMAKVNTLNGNEMGLGKTVEVIAAWHEAGLHKGQHLVIAPKTSLDGVWRVELERWMDMPVFTWSGDLKPADRVSVKAHLTALENAGQPFALVTTPTAVRSGLPGAPTDGKWATVTVDEFHKAGLTNASGAPDKGSKFAQAMKKIQAQRKFLLSGTPMGGKPIKLWGALHWLEPNLYTSKWRWADEWLVVTDNGFGKEIGGLQYGREDDFYKAHSRHMVRRLKREVMPQLPRKIYTDVLVPMTPKQRKQYEQFAADAEIRIEEERLSAVGVLAEYARLKQMANAFARVERGQPTKAFPDGELKVFPTEDSPKLEPLMERLDEQGIRKEDPVKGELALVGTESARYAEMVAAYLQQQGLYVELITGKTKAADRTRIQQITRDPETRPQVIVMTTTAGGMSINLQEANSVHVLDETWNPDDQAQLEDRADRGSRETALQVFYYRTKGTVQEAIHELTQGKAVTNKDILDIRRQMFRNNGEVN